MNDDPYQKSKEVYLKSSLGEGLNETERKLLNAFLDSDEGKLYVEGAESMKNKLNDLRNVEVKTFNRQQMIEQFESTLKKEAEALFEGRRYLRLCLAILGLATLFVPLFLYIPHPRHGITERLQGIGFLYGLLAVFCAAIGWNARKNLQAQNLFLNEKRKERRLKNPINWIVMGLCIVIFWMLWGFLYGSMVVIGMIYFGEWVKRQNRKIRMKQDAELWGWWEEEAMK